MVSAVALAPVCASPAGAPVPGSDPPGWADAPDGATARASGPSRERQRRASGADAAGPPRLDPMRQPTVQFYRAAASKPEPGAGAKTTARPGQRAGATVAVKPSHPQRERLAQLLHTTSYMVPGGCACGQRFLTTHVGQTLEQAALRMTR